MLPAIVAAYLCVAASRPEFGPSPRGSVSSIRDAGAFSAGRMTMNLYAEGRDAAATDRDGWTLDTCFAGRLLGQAKPAGPLCLWYRQPAVTWTEALALGNGRLGGMVFGGVNRERIQINEDTLWSGGPYDRSVGTGAF